MNVARRRLVRWICFAAAFPLAPSLASARGATRIVVGFPRGGPLDIAARLAARVLSEHFEAVFEVENIVGESGNVATGRVASAQADGHTLLLCGPVNAINTTLFPELPFVFSRDLVAVSGLYSVPLVVEVHPDVPVRTAADLLSHARTTPRPMRVGFAGRGTPQHIGIELFKSMARVDFALVPYAGSAPALADLLAGRIDAMFDPLPSSIGHIRAGRLRPLAVTGMQRIPILPGVPAMSETIPGYEAGSWFGLCAPRGTPPAMVAKMNAACNAALQDEGVLAQIAEMGGTPMPGSAKRFAAFIAAETSKYARVIRDARIELAPEAPANAKAARAP